MLIVDRLACDSTSIKTHIFHAFRIARPRNPLHPHLHSHPYFSRALTYGISHTTSAKKYVKDFGTDIMTPSDVTAFVASFKSGTLDVYVKSENRELYPNDMEPVIPYVYRVTANTFVEVVCADDGMNILCQV